MRPLRDTIVVVCLVLPLPAVSQTATEARPDCVFSGRCAPAAAPCRTDAACRAARMAWVADRVPIHAQPAVRAAAAPTPVPLPASGVLAVLGLAALAALRRAR